MAPPDLTALAGNPMLQTTLAVLALALLAAFSTLIVRKLLLKVINRALDNTSFGRDEELRRHKVIPRLANIVPAIFVLVGVSLTSGLSEDLREIILNVTRAFMVLTLARALGGAVSIVDTIYHRTKKNRQRPIKGYLQIVRIAIFAVAAILIIAALLDKSPVILLSGLGAMAAVLLLVFQDTLLSFVASIQISLNDMVRVGDWVEMSDFKADGEVIEIALHTVKIKNWDNTISSIPTRNMVTHSFRNWRGMIESGGRRIKRAVHIDQSSVRFLTKDEVTKLSKLRLLNDYLTEKSTELREWNASLDPKMDHAGNQRRLTNLGTFRAYLNGYIKQHPDLRADMTLMVRHLEPTHQGIPIEIYCFTNTTTWTLYEAIQSDIFEHILSIAPDFGLRVFQAPSGHDLANVTTLSMPIKKAAA